MNHAWCVKYVLFRPYAYIDDDHENSCYKASDINIWKIANDHLNRDEPT